MTHGTLTKARRAARRWRATQRRLTIIETDLDGDIDGSIAQKLGDLHTDVEDLRARIAEWETGMATAEHRRELGEDT